MSSDDLVGHLLEFLMLHEGKKNIMISNFFTLTVLLYTTQPHQSGAMPANILFTLLSVIALSSSKLQS